MGIDECKAFKVVEVQLVTPQPKKLTNEFICPPSNNDHQERPKEIIDEDDQFALANLCYSTIDKCKAFTAEEGQLITPQPNKLTNEFICPSLHKEHQERPK